MCAFNSPSTPKAAPAPAAAVPLPAETAKPAAVEAPDLKIRKTGRSKLIAGSNSGASATGMSGLNIPT